MAKNTVKSINLLESDLYQNGAVYVLEDGTSVLLRERYEPGAKQSDTMRKVNIDQDIRLLAFREYKDQVQRASNWWWLIADRNAVFDPIFNKAYDDDGNVIDVMSKPILVPNVLKQKPLL